MGKKRVEFISILIFPQVIRKATDYFEIILFERRVEQSRTEQNWTEPKKKL